MYRGARIDSVDGSPWYDQRTNGCSSCIYCWGIDWSLWLQRVLVKQDETQGLLTVWYTGADEEEVDRLKVSARSMRSFYEIVCISGNTVEFVTVHKSKSSTVNDEQLSRCLK